MRREQAFRACAGAIRSSIRLRRAPLRVAIRERKASPAESLRQGDGAKTCAPGSPERGSPIPKRASFVSADAHKRGILLVNSGTPASLATKDVRAFLAGLLGDPRVVELPRWLWLPILYGIILRVRPRASAKKYAAIWTPQGSPLSVYSEELRKGLENSLRTSGTRCLACCTPCATVAAPSSPAARRCRPLVYAEFLSMRTTRSGFIRCRDARVRPTVAQF